MTVSDMYGPVAPAGSRRPLHGRARRISPDDQGPRPPGPDGRPQASHLLWSRLPGWVAEAFTSHIDALTERIESDVRAAIKQLPDDGADLIVHGARRAIGQCLADITAPDGRTGQQRSEWVETFREFGRLEFRRGRSLDTLQAIYRVAGRSSWTYVAEFTRGLPVSTELLALCAEAVFATVDDIALLSAEGYAAARAESAGSQDRLRRDLLRMIIDDNPASRTTLHALAATVGWAVPDRVVAVALAPTGSPLVLDDAVLRDLDGPRPCLVTGDPDVHLARLGQRLQGRRAAIGPAVAPDRAGESLRIARQALTLVQEGLLPDTPVLSCDEHLLSMWLVGDRFLTERLGESVLAPFRTLTPRQRARLGETLLQWLQRNGNAIEVAAHLQVHPQTVRYRMHQLQEMFGDRLADPEIRLAMTVVLRSAELTEGPN